MKQQRTITKSIAYWGDRIIIAAVLLEIILFYSLPNLAGCLMTLVSWWIFKTIGLKEKYIINHLFPWLIFLSMSLYRILPLIATLLEGKPVSYCFKVPFETFLGETLLYVISALAFWLVARRNNNNIIKKLCREIGIFRELGPFQMWILGFIGFAISIYVRDVEMGDVGGKFLKGLSFIKYAPLLITFPSLWNKDETDCIYKRNNKVILYFIALFILSFSGNSRYAMLEPIGTVFLLFFISVIRSGKPIEYFIKPKYIVGILLAVFIGMPILSDISTAMLSVRAIRTDVSTKQLFKLTWENFQDKEELRKFEHFANLRAQDEMTEDWSEGYLDNFAFNRYCNMRVTDVGLYNGAIAVEKGARPILQQDLTDRLYKLLPTPLLNTLELKYDKKDVYSRGDLLKGLAFGQAPFASLLVTSHLGDGIATFGLIYFIIQFFLFFLELKLVDSFSYIKGGETVYSIMGLIVVFSFLGQFKNAGGCCDEIGYILRGFWQNLFLFAIALKAVSFFKR